MHEMAIVQSIMDIVWQQAEANNAKRVVRICLEFGKLTAVQPESIDFAFEILSKGTLAEGAIVDVDIIPIKVHCMDCSETQTVDTYQAFCPSCSDGTLQIIAGRDEMRIAAIEIEE